MAQTHHARGSLVSGEARARLGDARTTVRLGVDTTEIGCRRQLRQDGDEADVQSIALCFGTRAYELMNLIVAFAPA